MRHDKDANDRQKAQKREAREALEAEENIEKDGANQPGTEESNYSEFSYGGLPEPKKKKSNFLILKN
jgi:hypothetical protein